ncbi:DUF6343 family protein [Kribbella albertanoniae]|uniref:DUF6343 family protein n=1 Tax=Kribbella albertanoniae TaxID=1266829 RepID=UPI0023579048|nr:DUF6343 family protein [Kribbella albertanoniae]
MVNPRPPRSALTLRLVLAVFGLVTCASAAACFAVLDLPVAVVMIAAILALVAAIDIAVIVRRMQHGERG